VPIPIVDNADWSHSFRQKHQPPATRRRFGALRGQVSIGPEFFEPLPEQELAAWE
jgi:hypothetical protein